MNKKILSILLSMILVLSMTACGAKGGSGDGADSGKQENSAVKKEDMKFQVGDYLAFDIEESEIIYDEESEAFNLILRGTVTNVGDETTSINAHLNLNAKQGGETIYTSQLQDADGNSLLTFEVLDEEIEPGATVDYVAGWELISEKDVSVSFGGYTSAVEKFQTTFVVTDRLEK